MKIYDKDVCDTCISVAMSNIAKEVMDNNPQTDLADILGKVEINALLLGFSLALGKIDLIIKGISHIADGEIPLCETEEGKMIQTVSRLFDKHQHFGGNYYA